MRKLTVKFFVQNHLRKLLLDNFLKRNIFEFKTLSFLQSMITEKEAAKKTPKHIQMSISLSVCKA